MVNLTTINPKGIYTSKEACELLGISSVTLWRIRRAGQVKYLKRGDGALVRFLGQHLLDYIHGSERGGKAA